MAQDVSIGGVRNSMTGVNQSSERPLLSFAVPTYNRAKYLDQLLGVLVKQLQGECRVEVIVSDNASTDNTPAVVECYQQQGLDIRYLRNETNRGPDFNILQCFEQAAGKYVWIFGDDDVIAPGTLKRVLQALATQLYDLVCIRAFFFEKDCLQHKNFSPTRDLTLATSADLARHVHVYFTFISGVIINKERVVSMPHPPFDSLVGTSLAQLGPIYTALNHHRRSLLIQDPLIAATGNRHVGYAVCRVFGPTFSKITEEWLEKESVQKAIVNGTIQSFFPSILLLFRQVDTSSVSEDPLQVLGSCFGNNFRYWLFDYPICVLPLPLARIWLLLGRALDKADKLIGNLLVSL